MLRLVVPSLCGLALSGCATIIGPTAAPSCDGYSRRPLNSSMWNFEAAQAAPSPATEPDADGPAADGRPTLSLRTGKASGNTPLHGNPPGKFDVAGSLQPCTSERGHG